MKHRFDIRDLKGDSLKGNSLKGASLKGNSLKGDSLKGILKWDFGVIFHSKSQFAVPQRKAQSRQGKRRLDSTVRWKIVF